MRIIVKNTRWHFYLALLLMCNFSQAQSQSSNFWQNVRYGGGIGLGFSNGGFSGSITPSAIYQFNEKFAAGAGLSFNYSKYDNSKFIGYGGSLLTYYNPIPYIQLSGEFEELFADRRFETVSGTVSDTDWIPALYLGAGYRSRNFTLGVRYDVLYDDNRSIYSSPWAPFVRIYF